MSKILRIVVVIVGTITLVLAKIATKISWFAILVLTILKLTSVLTIPWFAGLFSLGAISTGLFMFFGGIIVTVLSALVTINSAKSIED